MDASEISALVRGRFGMRIEAASNEYLRRRLQAEPAVAVPVMGGDSRTGVPVRKMVALDGAPDAPGT